MIAVAPMENAEERVESAKPCVLLLTQDHFKGRSYVAALEKATVLVEWVTTASALQMRLARGDLPRPALVMVFSSRDTSMLPSELTRLALRLTADAGGELGAQKTPAPLGDSLNDYCLLRSLSRRQRQILEMYLIGNNDKEIAGSFNCSATTVYEHWRRMAKKANGVHKSDVVTDFHRFLGTRSEVVSPSLLASPPRSIPSSEP